MTIRGGYSGSERIDGALGIGLLKTGDLSFYLLHNPLPKVPATQPTTRMTFLFKYFLFCGKTVKQ